MQLIHLKWAGHYYGCLPVCLLANLPSPHKFAAALFQRCNSRVTKQRMFWQVHCNFNGVDAPKKERRAENYASSFGQSVIYAIMHCTMQPPLLPPQSPIFAIMHGKLGLFTLLPISGPHPASTSKQSASNCIRNPIKLHLLRTHIAYQIISKHTIQI